MALSIQGEPDNAEYRILLSPSQFAFMIEAARADDLPIIEIQDNGVIRLQGGHANMAAKQLRVDHPLFEYDHSSIEIGASGSFNVRELQSHVDLFLLDVDPNAQEPSTVDVRLNEGHVHFGRTINGIGLTESRIAGRGVRGEIGVTLDTRRLAAVLSVFPPDAEVDLLLPKFQGNPILLTSEGIVANLMPWKTALQIAREHVEMMIADSFGDLALKRDLDGDYPLRRHGNLIFGRLSDDSSPIAFQVFGVLVRDLAASPELLAEINQINTQFPFAKLLHVAEQLIVEADLVALSMDPLELETAVSTISRAMDSYASTLSVVFGGATDEDPMASRWSAYRETIVKAEISPGSIVDLNGPDAVAPWPFSGVVHVVSGWNPQGVALDGQYINSQIAADVLQRGARFVHCEGVARDGTYAEPSLAIWGLSRDQAREIGRKASQDAIFEIEDTELRLVACFTNHAETYPRREGPGPRHEVGYL